MRSFGGKGKKMLLEDEEDARYVDHFVRTSCVFCYQSAREAALVQNVEMPSTYSKEVRKGLKGDPICGECLIVVAFLRKVEEAQKRTPGDYNYGHDYRDYPPKPETVRGKRVFGKPSDEA